MIIAYAFVSNQWVPEITHHCQKTPFLLVGTQIDLRDENSTLEKLAKNKQKPISMEQGEKLAKELKAVKYVECSALTQVEYRFKAQKKQLRTTINANTAILFISVYFFRLHRKDSRTSSMKPY